MTTTEQATTTERPGETNGVPTAKMFGAIAKFTDNPALAAFRFSASNTWVDGTASTSSIENWYGIGADQKHVQEFQFSCDHPTLGHGYGPTPQEYVLHALACCITAGIATGAAARGIRLHRVTATATGAIDVRGVLGVDPDVRKGFSSIEVSYDVDADADDDTVEALIASATKYSAVFDMLTGPTRVSVGRSQA